MNKQYIGNGQPIVGDRSRSNKTPPPPERRRTSAGDRGPGPVNDTKSGPGHNNSVYAQV